MKEALNNSPMLDTFVIGNLEKNFLRRRNEAMNTDIEVSNVEPAIKLFEEDLTLFAVTFSPESSETQAVKEVEVANGGSSIYRREIWNDLGGIDLLFEPYWWDDVDCSYRARKRGYKILEDGRIKVKQKGELGVRILARNPKAVFIERRNHLLFLMKHKPSI